MQKSNAKQKQTWLKYNLHKMVYFSSIYIRNSLNSPFLMQILVAIFFAPAFISYSDLPEFGAFRPQTILGVTFCRRRRQTVKNYVASSYSVKKINVSKFLIFESCNLM